MTVTEEPGRAESSGEEGVTPRATRRRDAAAALEVCPFLAAPDGSWRSAYAAREHRCHAVTPAAQLAIAKQRELCLLAAHRSCATFAAAAAVASERLTPSPGDDGAALWDAVPAAPVVLEPARRMGALPPRAARTGGQALLVGLMVVAFVVLAVARTQSPSAVAGSSPAASGVPVAATASLQPTSAASPAVTPAPSPSATPEPTPATTPEPTVQPTASATAAATRTYKVRSGDTLSGIAARYGTTVKKLAALNGITNARSLRIGQVLQIP